MQPPASPRSLPGGGAGGDLTQPSPRVLHLRQLPACFTRLGRSPEAEEPERVWTVRGEARPTDIIITDICLNHKPDLTLNTASVRHDLRQLSVVDLHKQATHLPYGHRLRQAAAATPPTQQACGEGGCCLLGAARAFFARLVSLVRSGAVCGQALGGQERSDEGGARGWPPTQQQQQEAVTEEAFRTPANNPPASSVPESLAARAVVMAPEVVVTPERDIAKTTTSEAPWPEVVDGRLQRRGRLTSISADTICQSPEGGTTLLQPPSGKALHHLNLQAQSQELNCPRI